MVRSLSIILAMAGFVDVPQGKFPEVSRGYDVLPGLQRRFNVHSGPDKPEDSFAATLYGDYWYWIETADLRSRQVFTLMLFLTTLTDSGSDENNPVLTIPTG